MPSLRYIAFRTTFNSSIVFVLFQFIKKVENGTQALLLFVSRGIEQVLKKLNKS